MRTIPIAIGSFLLLEILLVAIALPLSAQETVGEEEGSPAEEVVVSSGDERIAATPLVSPYNRSFFVISNLSLWFLWAILIIVTVILISLRRIVVERATSQWSVRASPPSKPPATPLVEPKKVVTIKVRRVSKRKPKQHVP